MNKFNLTLHVKGATHFLSWELPYFQRYFNVVNAPDATSILFSFGPDVLESGAFLPAKIRVALLFPGFGYSPYHNLIHRFGMRQIIDEYYDLVFVNPGPIYEAFKDCPKLRLCPFSIDVSKVEIRRCRKELNSLLHVSANYPQKRLDT